jgi:hypothetical protein
VTPKQRLAKKKANARHEERESSYVEREETRMESKGWSEERSERRAHRLKKR